MKKITAYKGFDENMQCLGYQFEVGQTYEHDGKVEACKSGFHACTNPIDVFGYYNPATSRFAEVTLSGDTSDDASDSKIAAAKITIEAELAFPDFVQKAVAAIVGAAKGSKKATNTGNYSAATNTGYQSAATNTGYLSAATNTGNWGAATVTGKSSIAISTGNGGKARASEGSAIVIVERDTLGNLLHIFSSRVGENGIEPDVFYRLIDGKPLRLTKHEYEEIET